MTNLVTVFAAIFIFVTISPMTKAVKNAGETVYRDGVVMPRPNENEAF